MQKDPHARYHSGDEFAEDLVAALKSGLGAERRAGFGDADKFAALRALPFFKRFAEPELWELVRIGEWQLGGAGIELRHCRRCGAATPIPPQSSNMNFSMSA
jgi:hypothetical protein